MPLFAWVVVFSLAGGALSIAAAANFLILPQRLRNTLLPALVSFATGALLGAAFLALLPHALEGPVDPHQVMRVVLAGILAFFLLEKALLWHRCREREAGGDPTPSVHPAGYLILLGDGIHNFVDGVLIASAFLTSIELGVVTSIAVAAHEIPQEIGDFAILLHSGFSRLRALLYNVLSSVATLVGAVIAYFALSEIQHVISYVLAIAAASFIYIAVADLIPNLHRSGEREKGVLQFALILAGVGTIAFVHSLLH